ncbi:ABC transporter permease [Lentzea sp. NBC_00516]|uniref:ABC transporter permease n=1 Tax=Lentzea sp. NBC_00516 TaxID=2903582 RepID=UPI002E8134BB|nr:ABC transporter permease [Lentzea sp. NBC_00516]WUD25076.1 ABC transporter permease [Lentzea sp. NBC_00516]
MTHVLDRPAAIATPTTLTRRKRLGLGKPIPYGRVLGPALVIAVWSIASATGALDPRILSAPWTIVHTGIELTGSGKLPESILTSLQRAALGFFFGATAGTVLAVLSGLSRVGEALIDGTVQVKRAIPSLGLIPLLILWLGIGEEFKIVVIAVTIATIMYLQTYAALTGIDSRYVELAEAVGLSRTQYVRRVVFPGALPGFFLGLRLAVTASWLSLVVLEQINATSGIGYLMFQAQNYGQTDVIVVGLVVYGLFGFVSDALLRIIERRALAWRRTLSG